VHVTVSWSVEQRLLKRESAIRSWSLSHTADILITHTRHLLHLSKISPTPFLTRAITENPSESLAPRV
jgi:hypothetical protein